jgi:hypothetical protein
VADQDAFEALQGDMADHQRRTGREVTAAANQALLGPELERAEKMIADATAAAGTPAPEAPPPVAKTIDRKDVKGRSYLLSKQEDTPLIRVASPIEAEFLVLAEARMVLLLDHAESGLLGAASWKQRVLAVMATKAKAASWKAAAEAPDQLEQTRNTCRADYRLCKVLGLETISQLTPAFCVAKAQEFEQQFLHEFIELLDTSTPLFGDWKNAPAPKLTV